MPPPLVYLLPDDFYGPVFALFGQPDGVDPQPDPLGRAVRVPENGLVRIRPSFDDVVSTADDARPFIMVKVAQDGMRKVLFIQGNDQQDNNGDWMSVYINDQGTIYRHLNFADAHKPSFYYFSESQKKESMVFRATGCAYQIFGPDPEKSPTQPCGKFLILTPNMMLSFGLKEEPPYWMWQDLDGYYRSVADLEKDLNDVVKKKKDWLTTLKQP